MWFNLLRAALFFKFSRLVSFDLINLTPSLFITAHPWNVSVFFLLPFSSMCVTLCMCAAVCTFIKLDVLSENGQLNWVIITLIGRIKKSLTFPFYQMVSLVLSIFTGRPEFFFPLQFWCTCKWNIRWSMWVSCIMWNTFHLRNVVCTHGESHILPSNLIRRLLSTASFLPLFHFSIVNPQ